MNKKHTYEYVKQSFENDGYELLSDEYTNAKTKLDYICSKGHEHNIRWYDWNNGHKCPSCAGQTKPTFEYVKCSFEKEKYILLSKKYNNTHTKLDYKCSKGHEHSITWNNWQLGQRCSSCYGNTKLTLKQIKESFEQEGYILDTKKYKNNKTKLDYICPNGHNNSMKWNVWQRGHRCPTCYIDRQKLTYNFVKESFKKENYILLSKEYVNADTKLDYRCSKNHEHGITYHSWYQGCRCPTCRNINLSIRFLGSGGPGWKGGISFEPYCEAWKDKEYKQDIRNRDGNKCLNPACTKKYSGLTIHHIDYNKKNCSPSNLITVCRSCNGIANFDREWHTAWYKALLYRRYKL